LWKVRNLLKIKVFLWFLAKQLIPTGDALHRRNMATDSSCSLYGEMDSWQHSLLNKQVCVSPGTGLDYPTPGGHNETCGYTMVILCDLVSES
jgi:hypothetical protein